MSIKKKNLKNAIREYLLDEGILRKMIPDPDSKLDFGFMFSFPPGTKDENMNVFKIKNKNFITISLLSKLSNQRIAALNSLKKEKIRLYFTKLRYFFLSKEVYFQIGMKNNRYEIKEQIFVEKDETISRNSFFKLIKKIFYCYYYSIILLDEFCSGEDIIAKENDSGFNFSLYT